MGIIALVVALQISVALANADSLGVSTAQVLVGLPKFNLQEAPLVDGRARRLGQTEDRMVILELIGPKDDLTQAHLAVIGTQTPHNKALLARFVQNTVPGWPGRDAWVKSALKHIAQSPSRTIVGSRVVEMERLDALGQVAVTISVAKPAGSSARALPHRLAVTVGETSATGLPW